MRDTSDRRRRIAALVRQRGSVQVASLAEMFGVSAQAIRKDLKYLADRGIATRSYGGAICAGVVGPAETAVEAKRVLHTAEKERIGRAAAAMVQPGESVLLDSGTTTLQIAHHLPDLEEITVVTNDFGVLSALASRSRINVVVLGGALRRKNIAFYGGQAEAAIEKLYVDKLFLGVDGFHLEKGITTHYEPEAMLNRKMARVARQVIAVTDSSKFERVCLHRIIGVEDLDVLITDSGAPDYIVNAGRSLGCEVVVV
jgi:DeoR family transcriptional regulator, aga operon transcriptional repressor